MFEIPALFIWRSTRKYPQQQKSNITCMFFQFFRKKSPSLCPVFLYILNTTMLNVDSEITILSKKIKNKEMITLICFQITLIKSGWNELMIIGAAYRSLLLDEHRDGILMGQGKLITQEDAHRAGLGEIFERVRVELVSKMKEMKMVSLIFLYLFVIHLA